MFEVRPLATVGVAVLCLGVVLAGLGGGTAAAASSGSLTTTTTVSAVPTTQPYGVPGQEFVVIVSSSAAPTGTVAVSSGGQQLCTNLELNPVGSTDTSSAICVDTGDTLAVTATVIALYSPDTATFAPSRGKASGVVVAASTSASLSTSDPSGTWGAEQRIVFTGSVTNTQSGSTGTPTGAITVEQGATVICTIQLSSGSNTGTCAPDPTGLAPGADQTVTAIYDGDTNFRASAVSAPVTETIVEAAATVTPQSQTMAYGGGVPALTATVSGLVAGQTLATSGISGQAACATTATRASGVGAYPITCSVGTLSSPDYAFTFAPGTLTISQAATTTSVNVSASTVTVSVSPQFSGSPPGTVAVSFGGTSASCTLAPQANGPSNCSVPVPTSLAAGTYPVTRAMERVPTSPALREPASWWWRPRAPAPAHRPAEVWEGAVPATPGRPGAAGPPGLQVARRRSRAAESGAPIRSRGPTRPLSSCWPSPRPGWRSSSRTHNRLSSRGRWSWQPGTPF